jgi:hypothetical protein
MENFEKLQMILDEARKDLSKFFEKKNDSAGARLRSSLKDLKNTAEDLRKEIQELRKENEKQN